jgi:hypothetical protein
LSYTPASQLNDYSHSKKLLCHTTNVVIIQILFLFITNSVACLLINVTNLYSYSNTYISIFCRCSLFLRSTVHLIPFSAPKLVRPKLHPFKPQCVTPFVLHFWGNFLFVLNQLYTRLMLVYSISVSMTLNDLTNIIDKDFTF